jgi:hypothetical protein
MNMASLQPFGQNIWIADGEHVSVAGFHYPTRLVVVRLGDGGLFVWSPTALTEGLRAEVAGLGAVRFIVAPNSLHHLFVASWQAAFPDAKTIAAPGLSKRRKDLSFAGELGDTPDPGWEGDIEQVVVRGNAITTEVVFFHKASGTVLFTDLLQNFSPASFTGWRALVARLDRMTAAEPQVLQKFRVAFTDRKAARDAIRRVLAWPARQVLMAHGPPVVSDAAGLLRRAFRWLKV